MGAASVGCCVSKGELISDDNSGEVQTKVAEPDFILKDLNGLTFDHQPDATEKNSGPKDEGPEQSPTAEVVVVEVARSCSALTLSSGEAFPAQQQNGAATPVLCKVGCGRGVFKIGSIDDAEIGRSCCRSCACTEGKAHDKDCDLRSGVKEVLLVRVLEAELSKSCTQFGHMDPFASVDWIDSPGEEPQLLANTPTAWGAHRHPVWNYTCLGHPYVAKDKGKDPVVGERRHGVVEMGAQLVFKVWEESRLFADELCGEVTVSVEELLKGARPSHHGGPDKISKRGRFAGAKHHQLELLLEGEHAGTFTVQCVLAPRTMGSGGDLTRVDTDFFESPVRRMEVSGGTAPFFHLKLVQRGSDPGRSENYYIGKDLAHTHLEVQFYEEATALAKQQDSGLKLALDFMIEYIGVFKAQEEAWGENPFTRASEMVVMRNLFDGAKCLRMLDIKIGERTASAGWYGKSRVKALYRDVMDGFTNSACEGFRLAGFNGQPESFSSRRPLRDLPGAQVLSSASLRHVEKKAMRVVFSVMQGWEMFMHLLDLHNEKEFGALESDADIERQLVADEVAEIVLHEVAVRLHGLALACRHVPVPQKWVGSSVALAFDAGVLPNRGGEEDVRNGVRVHIFDWGRSELNTLNKHAELTEEERHDRDHYWQNYVGGVDRLAWEAARAYENRYGNNEGWASLEAIVYDFDSTKWDDFLGKVMIPLEATEFKTVDLHLSAAGEAARAVAEKAGDLAHSANNLAHSASNMGHSASNMGVGRSGNYLTNSAPISEDPISPPADSWRSAAASSGAGSGTGSELLRHSSSSEGMSGGGTTRSMHTRATLTYSIRWRELPAGSRLQSQWRFVLHSAAHLPICDTAQQKSDPYVVLIARPHSGKHCFRQQSAVIQDNLNPVWEETFDFSLAVRPKVLELALHSREDMDRRLTRSLSDHARLSTTSTSSGSPRSLVAKSISRLTTTSTPPGNPGSLVAKTSSKRTTTSTKAKTMPELTQALEAGGHGSDRVEDLHLLDWEHYLNGITGTSAGIRRPRLVPQAAARAAAASSNGSSAAVAIVGRATSALSGLFGANRRPADAPVAPAEQGCSSFYATADQ